MAISKELREIYATAPNDTFYVEALSLFHSTINTGDIIHITNRPIPFDADFLHVDGSTHNDTFNAIPFIVKLPKQDETGSADMDIAISNTSNVVSGASNMTIMERMEMVSNKPMEPLRVAYRVYKSTGGVVDPAEQLTPAIFLDVTEFQITGETVSMKGSKANLFNRAFPARVYDIVEFPGLR
jgi:hypothetical protein